MTPKISRSLLARIEAEAAASPHEICGLLLGGEDEISEAISCRNVAPDPADTFEIDPTALFAAHRSARSGGSRIVGHYHSHPNGIATPSARDAAAAHEIGAIWLIVTIHRTTAWRTVAPGRFEELTLDVAGVGESWNAAAS